MIKHWSYVANHYLFPHQNRNAAFLHNHAAVFRYYIYTSKRRGTFTFSGALADADKNWSAIEQKRMRENPS